MAQLNSPLRFRGDGTFTVMQVADTHLTPLPHPATLRLLERALDRQWPDLVVFSGDQLKGGSPLFHRPDGRRQVRRTLDLLLAPLEQRQVPFLVTFGAGDQKTGQSLERQLEDYLAHPLCRNGSGLTGGEPGCLALPVLDSAGMRPAFALYLFAAHGGKGGRLPVPEGQLTWFRETRDALTRQNGTPLPALAFQHMPVPEYRLVLDRVKPGTPGGVAVGHGEDCLLLPPRRSTAAEFLGQAPTVPDTNGGQLATLTERGDVLALYCGCDHQNSFLRRFGEMDLGCTPCCGFQTAGPGVRRGVRVFRLRERELRNYQTKVLTYGDLVSKRPPRPVWADLIKAR